MDGLGKSTGLWAETGGDDGTRFVDGGGDG